MTTKLELGHYRNTPNGIHVSRERELLVELPDEKGRYDTSGGEIGLSFSEHKERGYKYVELEIGQIKVLQTRDCREKRRVNVSNEGKGQVQLAKGRILFVTTDAFERRWKK